MNTVREAEGRSPSSGLQIVLADADINAAVERAVHGCFDAAEGGRVADLLLVHQDIHDEFVAQLKRRAAERPRASQVAGVCCDEADREYLTTQLDDAWTRGAAIDQFGTDDGRHGPTTIVTGVTHEMALVHSGMQAPIAPIMKITSIEEARLVSTSSGAERIASLRRRGTSVSRDRA